MAPPSTRRGLAKAVVLAGCVISTTPINFGTSAASNFTLQAMTTTGGVTVNCDLNLLYDIQAGVGLNWSTTRRLSSGTNFIDYDVFTAANHLVVWGDSDNYGVQVSGSGTGSPTTHTAFARVPVVGVAPALGNYTDQIVFTILF